MRYLTRTDRIMRLTEGDSKILERLNIPSYESCKGTWKEEQNVLLESKYIFQIVFCFEILEIVRYEWQSRKNTFLILIWHWLISIKRLIVQDVKIEGAVSKILIRFLFSSFYHYYESEVCANLTVVSDILFLTDLYLHLSALRLNRY